LERFQPIRMMLLVRFNARLCKGGIRFDNKKVEDMVHETMAQGMRNLTMTEKFAKDLPKSIPALQKVKVGGREIEIHKILQSMGEQNVPTFNYECLNTTTVATFDGKETPFQTAYEVAQRRKLELTLVDTQTGYAWGFENILEKVKKQQVQFNLRTERKIEKEKKRVERETRIETKEVRYTTSIASADRDTKEKMILRFLHNGDRCKISVQSTNGTTARQEVANMIQKLVEVDKSIIVAEPARLERLRVTVTLVCKKKPVQKEKKKPMDSRTSPKTESSSTVDTIVPDMEDLIEEEDDGIEGFDVETGKQIK
jgi:translation initiation factor IF-3